MTMGLRRRQRYRLASMERLRFQSAAAALALACGGCSFIFTTSAEKPRCSTSVAPPVLDTIFAAGELGRVIAAVAVDDEFYRDLGADDEDAVDTARALDIGFGLAFCALFTASAAWGFGETSECRDKTDAREELDRKLREAAASQRRWAEKNQATAAPAKAGAQASEPESKPPRTLGGFEPGSSVAAARATCEAAAHDKSHASAPKAARRMSNRCYTGSSR
jgi:hypothetical protein